MIIHAQTGQYRSRVLRPGLRRRVAVRRTEEMSAELRRAVGITICAALVFFLPAASFFTGSLKMSIGRLSSYMLFQRPLIPQILHSGPKRRAYCRQNILKLWQPCVSASMFRFQARFIVSDNGACIQQEPDKESAERSGWRLPEFSSFCRRRLVEF